MNLQGKTALITGASRGIGRAIAIELAQQGMARLILVARDRSRLEEVASEIQAFAVDAVILPLDLTDHIAVNISIAKVQRRYGDIDLLINCAGIARQSTFLQSKLTEVTQEISLNLVGMYTITRLVARRMAAQRKGVIVNVSSLMGKIAAPTMATYSATKFAILGFTQALRSELAPYNIRVVALLPSLTDTDMAKELSLFKNVIMMTPEQVAKTLIKGLKQRKSEILVGWQSHLAVWCQRLAPKLMEKILLLSAPRFDNKAGLIHY